MADNSPDEILENESSADEVSVDGAPEEDAPAKTFADLGLAAELCETCTRLSYTAPTQIQEQAIPLALQGRDILGLAQTGSGKTAAFALPILEALWADPRPGFAVVLAPTRELAYQIGEQFTALGSGIGVRCAVIVGGMAMVDQAIMLAKRPHIIVATPGRLEDHLANTKGFNLRSVRYLVMDEADRLLDMDFGASIDNLLKSIPADRKTYLFSATMTTKVGKLQRASLRDPVKVEVSSKYSTVDTLLQYYLFLPFKHKDAYLVYLANELIGQSLIIFVRTVHDAQRVSLVLRALGLPAIPLHGQMPQSARLAALAKFKGGARSMLIATDVAARGLDIPSVDMVIHYDLPADSKAYIHRSGRTARAGRAGKAIAMTTQYDIEVLQRLERVLGHKLDEYPHDKAAVMLLVERVAEAQRSAAREIRDNGVGGAGGHDGKKKRSKSAAQGRDDDRDRGDDDAGSGMPRMKRSAAGPQRTRGRGRGRGRGR